MKRFILTLACAATVAASFADNHQLTVKMTGLHSDTVVVNVFDKTMRNYERQDTVLVKNGQFTYDVKGDKAAHLFLQFPNGRGYQRVRAYAVPGEQGVLTGTIEKNQWSGSKFFTELAAYMDATGVVEKKMRDLSEDYTRRVSAGENADSLRNVLMPVLNDLMKEAGKVDEDFISNNPTSDVLPIIIAEMNNDKAEKALATLSDKVKKGPFEAFVEYKLASIEKEKAQKEAAKKVADGMPAPDFTLTDINGKPLSLSSLRGKYVVLDFWGSWCGWCIKGIPEMKKYYEKYAGKFEILGIDCNDTEKKWKDAVAQHQIPWLHVYNKRGDNDVSTLYAVTGFPTKIIIDPEGKIAKTVVGESPEFYEFLDSKFK